MNNISMAFLLTTMAGLSTMIGTIPIFFKLRNEDKLVAASLSFAAGIMLCVSVTDLIPESLNMLSGYSDIVMLGLVMVSIFVGIVISAFIDKALPSSIDNNSLYKVGVISMVAIIIHNLPEGIATFISTTKSFELGLSLTVAIAFHNIPEGISISVPIFYSTKSRLKALWYTFISALSEPLGAILTYLFFARFINETVLGLLFSMIAGIMIQISLTELLPTSVSYDYSKITKCFFVVGILFMLLKFFF